MLSVNLNCTFAGRVCVPFDPARVSEFNPELVPTVQTLAQEFNAFAAENSGMAEKEMVSSFFPQSCLKQHVEVFDRFLRGVHKAVNAQNIEHARQVRATPTMDF